MGERQMLPRQTNSTRTTPPIFPFSGMNGFLFHKKVDHCHFPTEAAIPLEWRWPSLAKGVFHEKDSFPDRCPGSCGNLIGVLAGD